MARHTKQPHKLQSNRRILLPRHTKAPARLDSRPRAHIGQWLDSKRDLGDKSILVRNSKYKVQQGRGRRTWPGMPCHILDIVWAKDSSDHDRIKGFVFERSEANKNGGKLENVAIAGTASVGVRFDDDNGNLDNVKYEGTGTAVEIVDGSERVEVSEQC